MRGMCFYPDKLVVNEVNEEYRPDLTFLSCVPGDYRNKKTAINKVVTNRVSMMMNLGSIQPGVVVAKSPWAAPDGRRETPYPSTHAGDLKHMLNFITHKSKN